jgi:hypothetical protein
MVSASLETGTLLDAATLETFSQECEVGVCDGRHSLDVMKTCSRKNTVQALGKPTSQTRDVGQPLLLRCGPKCSFAFWRDRCGPAGERPLEYRPLKGKCGIVAV